MSSLAFMTASISASIPFLAKLSLVSASTSIFFRISFASSNYSTRVCMNGRRGSLMPRPDINLP